MPALHPPVEAPIVRPFHYAGSPFTAGLHRGVDFGSRSGDPVSAPCSGRVAWSGTGGVTLVCAGRRITLLPLAPAVAEGARVVAGGRVGTAGGEPLHLGVRRPGDPFGYEDPERYLVDRPPAMPAVGPRPAAPRRVRPAAPPRSASAQRPAPVPPPALVAPWLAWVGVAVALAGAFGARRTSRGRRRGAARTRKAAAPAGVIADR
ncbi:MAG: hypothetical protein WKF94_01910 [Solirubrobacteraceae bacterium]